MGGVKRNQTARDHQVASCFHSRHPRGNRLNVIVVE